MYICLNCTLKICNTILILRRIHLITLPNSVRFKKETKQEISSNTSVPIYDLYPSSFSLSCVPV